MKANKSRKETDDKDFEEIIDRIKAIKALKNRDNTLILVVDREGLMHIANIKAGNLKLFINHYLDLMSQDLYN